LNARLVRGVLSAVSISLQTSTTMAIRALARIAHCFSYNDCVHCKKE
jgi:hypothetical protein